MFLLGFRDLGALAIGSKKGDSLEASEMQAEVGWLKVAVMVGRLRRLVMDEKGVGASILR